MSSGLATCNLQSRQLLNCPAEVLLRATVLTSLNLSRNKIVTLPRNINCLSILKCLELDCNQLEQVPHEIGYIHTLQNLSIRNNVLVSVPRSFGALTSIKTLHLSSNNITAIPPELFVHLPRCVQHESSLPLRRSRCFLNSLEICWLGQNRIEIFAKPNPGQHYNVPRLQQLWLNMNLLTEAPQAVLSSALTDLRYYFHSAPAATAAPHSRAAWTTTEYARFRISTGWSPCGIFACSIIRLPPSIPP